MVIAVEHVLSQNVKELVFDPGFNSSSLRLSNTRVNTITGQHIVVVYTCILWMIK